MYLSKVSCLSAIMFLSLMLLSLQCLQRGYSSADSNLYRCSLDVQEQYIDWAPNTASPLRCYRLTSHEQKTILYWGYRCDMIYFANATPIDVHPGFALRSAGTNHYSSVIRRRHHHDYAHCSDRLDHCICDRLAQLKLANLRNS
jgi:hypothetical protein